MKVLVTFEVETDEAGPLLSAGSITAADTAIRVVYQWWEAWLRDHPRARLTPKLVQIDPQR